MIEMTDLVLPTELSNYAAQTEPICTYSNYPVWAMVQARIGTGLVTFTGFNVEIINYTLTKHAEEMAILRALADAAIISPGKTRIIEAVAVQTASEDFIFPCGSCRQFIAEFAMMPGIPIFAVNADGAFKAKQLSALFPDAFDNLD